MAVQHAVQLSLFPMDPMVVMAEVPARAVPAAFPQPVLSVVPEQGLVVTPEEALENGTQYLHTQGGPGHRFTQTEVSKAVFAFRRWMEVIPEEEEVSRYARIFITEFEDSGYCLHPDEYPAYAPQAASAAKAEEAGTGEDEMEPEQDPPDQTAQAEEIPVDDGELQLEGEDLQAHRLNLSILKSMLSAQVFNSVTTTHYQGGYREGRQGDPVCHGIMERYEELVRKVHDVSALEAVTEGFLAQVPGLFREVREEVLAREKADRRQDERNNPEDDNSPLGDDNAPVGAAFT